jgi:Zn-dependent protease with chaperone function
VLNPTARHCATLIVGLLLLSACTSTTETGTVGVERKQLMLVSSAEMEQGAVQAYTQTVGEAKQKGALNQNPQEVARVRAVAARLIPQTAVFRADAPGWKWEVNVISSKEINAWCMPGGKIAFYTGLIETMRLTDDEMAAVMGHEISHALREHGRERVSQQLVSQTAAGLASSLLGLGQGGADLGGIIANVTYNLPYSRLQETEADVMGVELAARAGYDPRAAITLWQKMSQATQGGSAPPALLSTHPSNEDRIKELQVSAEKVMPLYEQARTKR